MAVSVDNVYQTVLALLDKEQRGYLTPKEFNLLANQAQIEIFEKYFSDQAHLAAGGQTDGDYNDQVRNIEEKITFFDNTEVAITQVDQVTDYPLNFWRLGRMIVNGRIADEVSHKDAIYIGLAPLTAPTATQPIYTRHEGGVRVYPDTAFGNIQFVYVREPAEVLWSGRILLSQLVLTPPTATPGPGVIPSIDFELHPSEEPALVAKILAYAGITVKAEDVIEPAHLKEQQLAQQ